MMAWGNVLDDGVELNSRRSRSLGDGKTKNITLISSHSAGLGLESPELLPFCYYILL